MVGRTCVCEWVNKQVKGFCCRGNQDTFLLTVLTNWTTKNKKNSPKPAVYFVASYMAGHYRVSEATQRLDYRQVVRLSLSLNPFSFLLSFCHSPHHLFLGVCVEVVSSGTFSVGFEGTAEEEMHINLVRSLTQAVRWELGRCERVMGVEVMGVVVMCAEVMGVEVTSVEVMGVVVMGMEVVMGVEVMGDFWI